MDGKGNGNGGRTGAARRASVGRVLSAVAGGVGLGLALATRWACLIGARLTVRAGAGDIGACFRLEL